jgi:uncharacterized membrane protein YcaP (DUF421 family)
MDLVIRATVVFFFVFGVTRVVGRRELSSLEPFDLILLVVLGDLIQQGITQSDYSVTGVFLVISTIGLLTVGVSYLNFRSKRLRSILEGEPVLVIQNGQPIMPSLKRERITTEELEAEARLQQISSLESVQWAVLETSGKISFIPKSDS